MNKINFGIHNKNFISKKMLIGPMVAGSLLCGSLSSCTNKPDTFKTNKIEYVNENKNKNPNLIISDNLELKNNVEKKRGAISGFKYVSKNDSSGKDFGKRISVGIIGGIIGGLIGTFKRGAGKGGTIGATAGVLFPGITLTAIITVLASYIGAGAGTFFSGGNDKIGKIAAAAFGFMTLLACLL